MGTGQSSTTHLLNAIFDAKNSQTRDPVTFAALKKLVDHGLLVRSEDQMWTVTPKGLVELEIAATNNDEAPSAD